MSVELSRKYHWLLRTPAAKKLPISKLIEAGKAINDAATYDDLPQFVKDLIKDGKDSDAAKF